MRSNSDSDSDDSDAEISAEEVLAAEFDGLFPVWQKMAVDYCAEFGLRPLLSEEASYSISELQPLVLGSYYLRLAAERSKIPNAW